MDRENTDRLAAHPILVETQDGIDGRAALKSIANHEHQIFRWVGPDRAGLRREAIQELRDRLHGDMLMWPAADGVICRNDPVAGGIMHQDRIGRAQRAFQNEYELRFRNRTPRSEAYSSLHARIDCVAHPKIFAENDLRHGAHGGILEVQGDAVATGLAAAARTRRVADLL
jgi:hypothetical protein